MVEVGQRFGIVTVLSFVGKEGGHRMWNFRCDCGVERATRENSLALGRTKSCGCVRKEKLTFRSHGMHKSSIYRIWAMMVQRCENPNYDGYENYGGRGIRVCERWRKFENFLEDMGDRPGGLEIDRKDNNGNYELGNCRWATRTEQCRNTRRNRRVVLGGEEMTATEAAEKIGIPRHRLWVYARDNGVSCQRAVDFYAARENPL